MSDMMRELHDDGQRRLRMTPLEQAVEDLERQERAVRRAKDHLKSEMRTLRERRARVARLRREGSP